VYDFLHKAGTEGEKRGGERGGKRGCVLLKEWGREEGLRAVFFVGGEKREGVSVREPTKGSGRNWTGEEAKHPSFGGKGCTVEGGGKIFGLSKKEGGKSRADREKKKSKEEKREEIVLFYGQQEEILFKKQGGGATLRGGGSPYGNREPSKGKKEGPHIPIKITRLRRFKRKRPTN